MATRSIDGPEGFRQQANADITLPTGTGGTGNGSPTEGGGASAANQLTTYAVGSSSLPDSPVPSGGASGSGGGAVDPATLTTDQQRNLSHLDSGLAGLLAGGSARSATVDSSAGSGGGASAVRTLNGVQGVTIDVTATDGDGAGLLGRLQAIGLQAGASFGAMASGFLPVANLGDLLDIEGLAAARASVLQVNAPVIPPQASNALHATPARTTYGVDGTGLIVGVLSDSFDRLGGSDTKATDIANGYLPANTVVLNDDPYSGGEDEGRGMAQIIHQIAPGASILFNTAEGGQATFAQHILDLAAAGAKVIVDDIGYFFEPAYQNGVIAQAIQQVEKQGVVYMSSAGNDGPSGYEGTFAAGNTFTFNGKTYTSQSFGTGAAGTDQSYLPFYVGRTGQYYDFNLQWSQPAASASPGHGATSDLDLFVVNSSGVVVGSPLTGNNIGGDPIEDGQYYFGSTTSPYYLKVGLASGSVAPADIKIRISGNGLPVTINPVSSNYNTGTSLGHNSGGVGYSGVGAVYYQDTPYNGTTPPVSEDFSSGGPDYIYYDNLGNLLPTPVANKIAFSATDGVDTSFFPPGSNQDSDGDGFPNFFGTSAAAPSAAAVAALLLQKNSSLPPVQVQEILKHSAIATVDSNGAANPLVGGAGFVQADAALSLAATLYIPFTTDFRSNVLSGFNSIVFDASGTGANRGVFTASQFASGISATSSVTGDSAADMLIVTSDLTSFSAAGFTFSSWNANDFLELVAGASTTSLTGSSVNDYLVANGASGPVSMTGGSGDDTYYTRAGDTVVEQAGAGRDAIVSAASYTLPTNVEVLYLNGSGLTGTGNNAGGDTLVSLGHNNALIGVGGNDTFYVQSGDTVTEQSTVGIDAVVSTASFILGANLEVLYLNGSGLTGTGKTGGNDTLVSLGHNNALIGVGGNDTFYVQSGDTVTEQSASGSNLVVSNANFTLGVNLQALYLNGSGLTGTGNGGTDNLVSLGHNNALVGVGGNDTFYVHSGDTVSEQSAAGYSTVVSDTNFTLGANLDALYLNGTGLTGAGNSGGNNLVSLGFNNVLSGNGGSDNFFFQAGQTNGDAVTDFAGSASGGSNLLVFSGFGTTAQGASFTQTDATHWQVHSGLTGLNETLVLNAGAAVQMGDVRFA